MLGRLCPANICRCRIWRSNRMEIKQIMTDLNFSRWFAVGALALTIGMFSRSANGQTETNGRPEDSCGESRCCACHRPNRCCTCCKRRACAVNLQHLLGGMNETPCPAPLCGRFDPRSVRPRRRSVGRRLPREPVPAPSVHVPGQVQVDRRERRVHRSRRAHGAVRLQAPGQRRSGPDLHDHAAEEPDGAHRTRTAPAARRTSSGGRRSGSA